ncbi:MAG: hypothetical protein GC193_13040 [Cryomorphaceae bacterium]|nr:hypothetical protein [Cryomorphaceae bacterium]
MYTKLILKLTFVIAVAAAAVGFGEHKFYFSRTTIEQNALMNRYEITIRFFTDDLERALSAEDEKVRFADDPYDPSFDSEVEDYIRKHFFIRINNENIQWRYLGKQVESDITWCYAEINNIPPTNILEIKNTALFELFDEQVNEVALKINGRQHRMMLTRQKPAEVITN